MALFQHDKQSVDSPLKHGGGSVVVCGNVIVVVGGGGVFGGSGDQLCYVMFLGNWCDFIFPDN